MQLPPQHPIYFLCVFMYVYSCLHVLICVDHMYVLIHVCLCVFAHVFSCTYMLACVLMHMRSVFVLICICSYTCVIIHVGDGKQASDVAC